MGKTNSFQFKQFTVHQNLAAMKVGTDGILLGAWADVSACKNILDVGTGTGLIALMMAQRSAAKVMAIEIEANAASEAKRNCAESPWKERIEVQHQSFQEFAAAAVEKFDLIVSNPPFFENSLKAGSQSRNLARHNDGLPFIELIEKAKELLNEKGKLAVVLPKNEGETFLQLATENDFHLQRKTEVKPSVKKAANRLLLEFGLHQTDTKNTTLIIYEGQGVYSSEFIELTKEFYLKF